MVQRYTLESLTIARIPDDGSCGTMLIPKDSIVEIDSELGQRRGLVSVTFKGHLVQMFAEDIRERGKPLPPEGQKKLHSEKERRLSV
jgi:hypothetical protein